MCSAKGLALSFFLCEKKVIVACSNLSTLQQLPCPPMNSYPQEKKEKKWQNYRFSVPMRKQGFFLH